MNARFVIESWPELDPVSSLAALPPRHEFNASRPPGSLMRVESGNRASARAGNGCDVTRSSLLSRRSGPPSGPLRHLFLLVNEFRAQSLEKTEPHRLGAVLNAIIQLAGYSFTLMEEWYGCEARLVADNKRCLEDLDSLLGGLLADSAPPPLDLFHAMDPLIVQFVRLDEAEI
jgi:hypothetical protein